MGAEQVWVTWTSQMHFNLHLPPSDSCEGQAVGPGRGRGGLGLACSVNSVRTAKGMLGGALWAASPGGLGGWLGSH